MKKKVFIFLFIILILIPIYVLYLKGNEKPLVSPFFRGELFKKEKVDATLSIDKIFANDHSWISILSADKKITMIATGDVIPARSVNFKTVTMNNFNWPYERTADILKTADLTFINLESPLINNCPLTNEGIIFCGDKRNIDGLIFSGVDVANLANNHSSNYGQKGLNSTIDLLSKSGILPSGAGSIAYIMIKNTRFAFLGYNALDFQPSNFEINIDKVKTEIIEAKTNADIVVVAFHWGEEYTPQPNKVQRDLAHLAIDSGGDLIIGNHPHWIQPVEIYKNKLIMYAHGNFVFDQMWSEKTREGVIGRYTFFDKKLVDVEFLPVKIESYGQPYFLEGEDKKKILNSLFKRSQSLLTL